MKLQSTTKTLSNTLNDTSGEIDVSDSQNDLVVQLFGIANSVTIAIQASADDVNWIDITKSFTDMNAGTALTGAVAASGMFRARAFAGKIRFKTATGASGGTPTVTATVSRQIIG